MVAVVRDGCPLRLRLGLPIFHGLLFQAILRRLAHARGFKLMSSTKRWSTRRFQGPSSYIMGDECGQGKTAIWLMDVVSSLKTVFH